MKKTNKVKKKEGSTNKRKDLGVGHSIKLAMDEFVKLGLREGRES